MVNDRFSAAIAEINMSFTLNLRGFVFQFYAENVHNLCTFDANYGYADKLFARFRSLFFQHLATLKFSLPVTTVSLLSNIWMATINVNDEIYCEIWHKQIVPTPVHTPYEAEMHSSVQKT